MTTQNEIVAATCPCCGGAVAPADFLVDLNTNTVTFRGQRRKARKAVIDVLYALNAKRPGTVRYAELIYSIYGNCEPEGAFNCLRQAIWWARKLAKDMGFQIKVVEKVGYRLTLD